MISAVIVEDEHKSRETLKAYVHKYCEGVEVSDVADSVQNGLIAIEKYKPQLVFLDIEMPRGNAFDLLESLKTVDFEIIFITAYDNYAIQAIKHSASSYLLKPLNIDELIDAVDKAKKKIDKNIRSINTAVLLNNLKTESLQKQKIVLPLQDGFEVVQMGDIVRLEANDNFTNLYFKERRKMMICRSLKFYEQLLSEQGFLRVHRSHMVNLDCVRKYIKGKVGHLLMSDGSTVELSPNRKDNFLKNFSKGK